MTDSQHSSALNASREVRASTNSGYLMLMIALVLLAFGVTLIMRLANDLGGGADVIGAALAMFAVVLILSGFYLINPNEAAAIQLFGTYKGSDRETGLRWVLPWYSKKKISVRANNLISDKIKVNDLRGNPIEMAAQVVWRVTDTAQALFDVDDYKAFVMVQIEAAVRTIGARYPYDDFTHQEVTLRGNHDQVGAELRAELIERLRQGKVPPAQGDNQPGQGTPPALGWGQYCVQPGSHRHHGAQSRCQPWGAPSWGKGPSLGSTPCCRACRRRLTAASRGPRFRPRASLP